MQKISYARYRSLPVIIQDAVWLYFWFPLSYRDIEDLLAERGVDVSYETVRRDKQGEITASIWMRREAAAWNGGRA